MQSDEMLDIMGDIGYRGIPQREVLTGIDTIVQ